MIRFYIDGTTGQDDRFLPILEDTVFHANVDYLILLDLI